MCPTGIHRAGTLAVLDIVLDRVDAEKKVGLSETVSIIRKQRYGCVASFQHYLHLLELIQHYIVSSGLVDVSQIGRLSSS
ncbi:unnamed protein product [Gongylonema pulchrum]|uniref:Tyrosine-protein phosphatase domain-containing protein n=1 Tax=Gongylonema pulchrum TaxID=637853 RepID=A0A183DS10_9BILA|nr:unnamed protein product [Gongylonema pulchrum]